MATDERLRRSELEELDADYPGEDHESGGEDEQVGRFQALLQDRRRMASGLALFVLVLVSIYVLVPKLIGFDDTLDRFDDAN